jgi:uncharacterized protein (TIGR02266 family)
MAKKKVLLADDVQLFLELEKSFLSREEVDIKVVRSGKEVLEAVAEEMPDLIFLDMFMPEMNGDECCRKLKSNAALRHIPVVMVTTGGREDELKLCRDAGCNEVVLKPINRHHFMETAKKFLRMPERAEPRYSASLRLHYGKDPDRLLSDFIINLSTGGVFLETDNPMPVDTPLIAEFVLPHNNRTISCRAKVAWVNHPELIKNPGLPTGIGLQFVDISMADIDAIRDYIKQENLLPSW